MKLNYFNFKKFGGKVLLTNDLGKYIFVSEGDFKKIIAKVVESGSELEKRLLEASMIYTDTDLDYSNSNMYDIREQKSHVNSATSLHIFVVTTSCNMSCVYCQANNGMTKPHLFMDKETAERAVDIALQSPEEYLSFEFQGGEPLLNFDVIKHIVKYAEEKKEKHKISYNVVTNLTLLSDEMLEYFGQHCFSLSTSLDGAQTVHDRNRKFADGTGTYSKVIESINRIRNAGLRVGAIETTTKMSLNYPEEIVKAYVNMGFDSIFIRPLTPLGKATVNWDEIGYSPEEFIDFYRKGLNELITINKRGTFIKEEHASIFLKRIDGQPMNYMELRSPCGAGIGQLAYYPDGNIFTCDEGRMLYEMGKDTFCLGNVYEHSYNEIVENGICRTVCAASILETIPGCCDCVYQPYCGTCPVVNFARDNDVIEKTPRGYKCKIYSGMLDSLFEYFLENDVETMNVLKSWSR